MHRLRCLVFVLLYVSIWSGCGRTSSNVSVPPSAQVTQSPESPSRESQSPVTPSPAIQSSGSPSSTSPLSPAPGQIELDNAVAQKLAEREALDRTLWVDEIQAQKHEEYFVHLWDTLRGSVDCYPILRDLQIPKIVLPISANTQALSLGVEHFRCEPPEKSLTPADWIAQLNQWQELGYKLTQSEWHHRQFSRLPDGGAESRVDMSLHIENPKLTERLIVAGLLQVRWKQQGENLAPMVESIETPGLQIWRRTGSPAFKLAATLQVPVVQDQNSVADFLGNYDTDGDGDAEIIFGNQIYRNEGGGRFSGELLMPTRSTGLNSAVLADFNNDGRVDLMTADPGAPPKVHLADSTGRFSLPPLTVPIPPLAVTQAITAGDINGDGHLDTWITQYKGPYDSGQMPTPYYDANDGDPSYLLIGDGTGRFQDATANSGLEAKRFRRTYSTSFVDLDDDRDLDLIVVSDFAGIDLYLNDGTGKFTDVSESWLEARNNFGMSHTFDDFDGDGRLDFYVTGMASTTARRLEQLGLNRNDFEQHNKMRPTMGYGNRMYLASANGFRQPEFRDQVARTGWSWGTSAFDLENDGDRDIFVGNGHISGKSATDYCSVFWRHDIYTGSSKPDAVLDKLFQFVQYDFEKNKGGSWNGFEHNCLLVKDVAGYVNLAFLMGVASEFDTRAVVSTDFDSDGRQDLLVVEHTRGRPSVLHVFRNDLKSDNHWVGVRLLDELGHSPLGAQIMLETEKSRQVAQIVSGNSFTSQHAAAAHFGLGQQSAVRAIEVRWVDGAVRRIESPQIDRYHLLRVSEKSSQ